MVTAICIIILILTIAAIFHLGIIAGGMAVNKRIAEALFKAIDESDLTSIQKCNLIEKIKKEIKR